MAWRNIWRNTRRSILTISAIAFAGVLLIFMLSWQFGSYDTMINASVKIQTGHLQVQAREYHDKRSVDLVVADPGGVMALLDRTEGVSAYTPRADAFSLVSSRQRTAAALVTGIDPLREARVSTLKHNIREGVFLSKGDTDRALVGRLLAERLKVGLGDELVLLGQGRDGSVAAAVVVVKGIFDTGLDEMDRSVVAIPLAFFQDVYGMSGAVHEVVILADALDRVGEVKAALSEGLRQIPDKDDPVVLDWMELMPGLIESIQMDLVSGFIMYIILILVVAFSILNTFLMAIFERKREFGVIMAIGTTPARLSRLLLLESAAMTLIGIASGILIGSLLTWYFQVHGIHISGTSELMRQFGLPDRIYPKLSLLSISIGSGIVLVITFLTALYPALRVRRLRPVEAMSAT
ncbi:MAG: ABC transporter permease [Deltaproteobacteria bacterium]|nr:ABC transporter permease [Deltaproteobacteria bacterium]MBW2283210.1 ABC transporter permease [Deltaproteobacteria bacterium]